MKRPDFWLTVPDQLRMERLEDLTRRARDRWTALCAWHPLDPQKEHRRRRYKKLLSLLDDLYMKERSIEDAWHDHQRDAYSERDDLR